LVLKIPVIYQMSLLDKPVSQGGFAVIDVGYDAKIADKRCLCH
jgi:hypothetical protein